VNLFEKTVLVIFKLLLYLNCQVKSMLHIFNSLTFKHAVKRQYFSGSQHFSFFSCRAFWI